MALISVGLASVLVLLFLLVAVFVEGDFSPGSEVFSGEVEQVAASAQDTVYPPKDVLVFEGDPPVVYVYVAVTDLDSEAPVEARAARSRSRSVLSRVFGGKGEGITVSGRGRLTPSGGGNAGVVRFAVRPEGGGALPSGDYTVRIFVAGDRAAVERFVVRRVRRVRKVRRVGREARALIHPSRRA